MNHRDRVFGGNKIGCVVYGASDDLIEFKGIRFNGEVGGNFDTDDKKQALVFCSDGTVLQVGYGKSAGGVELAAWEIRLVAQGGLFERIEECRNDEDDPHSDVAVFAGDLSWAYVAKTWERVQ